MKKIEWKRLPDEIKKLVEFKNDTNDGFFWMTFEDFYTNFDSIQFCHLTPGLNMFKILFQIKMLSFKNKR